MCIRLYWEKFITDKKIELATLQACLCIREFLPPAPLIQDWTSNVAHACGSGSQTNKKNLVLLVSLVMQVHQVILRKVHHRNTETNWTSNVAHRGRAQWGYPDAQAYGKKKKLLALGVKKRVVHQVWPRLVHQGLDDGSSEQAHLAVTRPGMYSRGMAQSGESEYICWNYMPTILEKKGTNRAHIHTRINSSTPMSLLCCGSARSIKQKRKRNYLNIQRLICN
jgi:hypothetical protein